MNKSLRIRLLAFSFSMLFLISGFTACKSKDNPSTSDDSQSEASSTDSSGNTDIIGSSDITENSELTSNVESTGSSSTISSTQGKTTANNSGTTQTTSQGTTKKVLKADTIQNMNGYSFVILSPLLPTKLESDSTLFEEQLFERIDQVEKDYNCKISILNSPYPDMENIQKYIMAGKKLADLLELTPSQMVAAAEMGYIDPWTKSSAIDVSDARWIESYTNLGYYDSKQYGLQFYRPAEARFCVVFNKTLLKANGIDADSIYADVRNGTWTFDKFRQYCLACRKDTNNDNKYDTFGFTGFAQYISLGFMMANGARLVTLNSNGSASATFTSEAAKNALKFYSDLVNTDTVMYTNNHLTSADPWNTVFSIDPIKTFLNGKAAFLLHESWTLNQQIKKNAGNMEYGMVPYPKGPNASGYTSAAQNARLFTLTKTNADYNKAAIIFNALARPVGDESGLDYWEDVQADYFQSSDKDSLDMYKLCLEKSSFDVGLAVDSLYNEFNSIVASSVFTRKTTTDSALDSIKNKFDNSIAALFK